MCVSNLAQEMGGLSRSVSYSLENEAYRLLPAFLETEYDIVLEERMVRTVIDDEEIDLFALGQRDGVPIVLVGETKLQLDRRRGGRDAAVQVLEQLARKAEDRAAPLSRARSRAPAGYPLRPARGPRRGAETGCHHRPEF